MERMVEKKTESLSREELLEACDILRSIQKECEGQASDPADGLSEAQHDGKASFYKKQAADIEHLIGTVQQMAENSPGGKGWALNINDSFDWNFGTICELNFAKNIVYPLNFSFFHPICPSLFSLVRGEVYDSDVRVPVVTIQVPFGFRYSLLILRIFLFSFPIQPLFAVGG